MVQYNSFNARGWLDTLDPDVLAEVEVMPGDVRDSRSCLSLADGAEVVYHLAALIAIPYSYVAPRSYLDTNAAGTMNVLEAVRTHGTPRLVHTSTSEVYGTAVRVPIDEGHPLQAQSPYAASKIAADKLVEAYARSYELPVVTLRPFNTYGPRQSTRAVIPTIISQLAAGEETVRLGALDPVRDFTFVTDTVGAFHAVATAPAEAVVGQVLNAGNGSGIAIRDLAELIARLMDRPITLAQEAGRLRPEASEVLELVCDATAIRTKAGWAPSVSLEEGLRRTIAWFSDPANLARYAPAEYTI
jgi:NAD dependent epimerase/dehydratase